MVRHILHSLRTKILAQLIFLIVAAMLLVNVVMMKLAERDLVQTRVDSAHLMIQALEQQIGYMIAEKREALKDIGADLKFKRNIAQLMSGSDFTEILIIDDRGELVLISGSREAGTKEDMLKAQEAVKTKGWITTLAGSTWGLIWLAPKEIMVSAPLIHNERVLGGITAAATLVPIYSALRASQKVILFYVLLNTLILAVVGIYLLSRIVLRPLRKLLKMSDEYKEGDQLLSIADESRDEIGQLSRSLNYMLMRLDENKKELNEHIRSLKRSNEELQQAQHEIIRSEKLASVGRLAAGIAHEIGNPIGIILGYLEMLNKGETPEPERKDFLSRIEIEITRINQIIRQLLDYSRPSSGTPQEASIHDAIHDTVNMLTPQPILEDVRINMELEAEREKVFADPNLLQQVFLNIIMNAADAFTTPETARTNEKENLLNISSRNQGDSIEVRFTDNGPGLDEESVSHIFDPFYTTKEPGKGTGLGLSVCYRILEEMGGTIGVESVEGKGTTLWVVFPLQLVK